MISSGFLMPAEWYPHDATWLVWPINRLDWPGKFTAIPYVYAEFVRLLAQVEQVHLIVPSDKVRQQVRRMLASYMVNLDAVEFHLVPTNRSWVRDFGPIFVHDDTGQTIASDWAFNGWAKYRNYQHDNMVPVRIAPYLMRHGIETHIVNSKQPGYLRPQAVVLEGGSIDTNGDGVILTTEQCLLSTDRQVRNPHMTRELYEEVLLEALGARQVIWLAEGIAGDDTHGHIDDLARFVDERTIVICSEKNPQDENHRPLLDNLERLRSARDAHGKRFTIVEIPMPRPVIYEGQRLPASYANFYIANDRVLVPTFHDPNDRIAMGILQELFPNRQVIGVSCVDLVWGLGTLHCATQQQPRSRHPAKSTKWQSTASTRKRNGSRTAKRGKANGTGKTNTNSATAKAKATSKRPKARA